MSRVDDNGGYSHPYRLGRLPAQPARPKVRFASVAAKLPAPPAKADWYSQVPEWPIYGNDRYGDCVEAGLAHHVEQITQYGQGDLVEVTDDDVLGAYSAITGFDPNDPSTDQGTVVEDALSWWRKGRGLAGHAITAYASVDLSDAVQVKQAIGLLGAIGLGLNLPRYALEQFDAGQPWECEDRRSSLAGGHYVLVVGYDGTYFYVITWGRVQKMTPAFLRRYAEEGWVVIDDEMVSTVSRLGADLHALGEEFASLTGEANPFPADPPTPQPSELSAEEVASVVRQALSELGL